MENQNFEIFKILKFSKNAQETADAVAYGTLDAEIQRIHEAQVKPTMVDPAPHDDKESFQGVMVAVPLLGQGKNARKCVRLGAGLKH